MSVVIGIAGGSASGKTLLAHKIHEAFESTKRVTIISQDDYYKDQSDKLMSERVKTNYDHPDAFDHARLVQDLKTLKSGHDIDKPLYDYVNHTRQNKTEHVPVTDIIILEGIFVLEEEDIRNLCDILVYVDTPSDIRLMRRLRRDMEERGRSFDSVCTQYMDSVRPMYEAYVAPSKKYAHIIVPTGGENTVAADLLITKVQALLNQSGIE